MLQDQEETSIEIVEMHSASYLISQVIQSQQYESRIAVKYLVKYPALTGRDESLVFTDLVAENVDMDDVEKVLAEMDDYLEYFSERNSNVANHTLYSNGHIYGARLDIADMRANGDSLIGLSIWVPDGGGDEICTTLVGGAEVIWQQFVPEPVLQ